ncbi:anhydro-N-acetylmuramic acid kinase [Nocardioides marinisabuli]|uniref:Anhydro-N-acetylmuramic acid kinase n=1 Tax=Nocardioides marinisabuli TaxID=419476 RepID=A0A7Y9JQY2_9ACTN|nr:anhydro-N-acetylmuramic acid kinase [Nocardioides marinisabuli]NYD58612.1 anhydro-N-acetylmuramic acid kinase [Nocardioides marinisabuli]
MIVAGLMTGTSADALDVALVDFTTPDDAPGDELTMELLDHREVAFPDDLGRDLLRLLEPGPVPLSLVADVDSRLGILSAEAIGQVLAETRVDCDLVVSHGQTVQHLLAGGEVRATLQIGQPAWIAERTGCPVLSDVRARDVAAGGQGAPLASMLDHLLLADPAEVTAALNLGGIANLTVVAPGADPLAYDTGPANALIDVMARRISGDPRGFDRGGAMAAAGEVDTELLAQLLDEPYYRQPAPKSTGKELFHAGYLDRALSTRPDLAANDVVATLTRLSAETVAAECRRHAVARVVASGGGTRNPVLMAELARSLDDGVVLEDTTSLGLPGDAKEAVLMALVGWLSWHGLPATLPSCTGASRGTVAGRITPGHQLLRLPEPRVAPPERLRPKNTPVPQAPTEGEL